jgi:hypothetical protein
LRYAAFQRDIRHAIDEPHGLSIKHFHTLKPRIGAAPDSNHFRRRFFGSCAGKDRCAASASRTLSAKQAIREGEGNILGSKDATIMEFNTLPQRQIKGARINAPPGSGKPGRQRGIPQPIGCDQLFGVKTVNAEADIGLFTRRFKGIRIGKALNRDGKRGAIIGLRQGRRRRWRPQKGSWSSD